MIYASSLYGRQTIICTNYNPIIDFNPLNRRMQMPRLSAVFCIDRTIWCSQGSVVMDRRRWIIASGSCAGMSG